MVDTSDEWITVRTGIKERRVLEEGKGNADMALRAARRALDDAGVEPKDLDAIIMGTVTRGLFNAELGLCAGRLARRAQRVFF